jgi:hypothetical protein
MVLSLPLLQELPANKTSRLGKGKIVLTIKSLTIVTGAFTCTFKTVRFRSHVAISSLI